MKEVEEFISQYSKAQVYLQDNDTARASQKYKELLQLYNQIQLLGTEEDKQIAHEQLCKLYYQIQEKPKSFVPYYAAAIFILLASFIILVEPSIVGLQIFPETIYQDIQVTTQRSGFINVTLTGAPTGLKIKATGTGKIYLVKDKNLVKAWEGGSDYECIDTCTLDGINTNKIVLLIETSTGIKLEKIKYTSKPTPNKAPYWTTETTTYKTPFTLNLNNVFKDEDGDELVYIASRAPGVFVQIYNNMLNVVAEEKGTYSISVYASDLKDVTRQPLTIIAE